MGNTNGVWAGERLGETPWEMIKNKFKKWETWVKNLIITPETVNFLEENIEEKLHNIGLGKDFMAMTPKI